MRTSPQRQQAPPLHNRQKGKAGPGIGSNSGAARYTNRAPPVGRVKQDAQSTRHQKARQEEPGQNTPTPSTSATNPPPPRASHRPLKVNRSHQKPSAPASATAHSGGQGRQANPAKPKRQTRRPSTSQGQNGQSMHTDPSREAQQKQTTTAAAHATTTTTGHATRTPDTTYKEARC
ncbi:hypothetical protein WOLCODRAFT_154796 [Wolfiporia cocos MD-104 SS10]|uniref:Uncharacterized protein n=1 Tax=Wolfiporia cocos (strain MD-104) TaxID=742152 RepID=A0A2H3K6R0_WOLCO|nr:hypothetical protein WOLCODRAFT_154796 [Wolfiporia cocos MD-104 SS10]